MTSAIIEALQQNPLQELAINGRSGAFYDAENLIGFDKLVKLTLIMPDSHVARQLPRWTERLAATLRELTIICKDGKLIHDRILHQIASHPLKLQSFSITNCANVTHTSIIDLLRGSMESGGITSLTLDGISTAFDWSVFTKTVTEEHLFRRLSTLTLTYPAGRSRTLPDLIQLVSIAPLQELNLSNFGLHGLQEDNHNVDQENADLLSAIINVHGATIQTLGLLRTRVTDVAMSKICNGLPNLRKFFFTRDGSTSTRVPSLPLPQLKFLEYFHVSFMSDNDLPFPGVPSEADIVSLAERCSPELLQCGVDTRVWKINREFMRLSDGEWSKRVTLGLYDQSEIPEAFLVVRA